MALGKEKGNVVNKYTLPLIGMNDSRWIDNTWLVEHLRHLANTIEEEQPKIHRIGIDMDAQYKSPSLSIEYFESRDYEKIVTPDWKGENMEKFVGLCKDLNEVLNGLSNVSDLFDVNKFNQHDKLCEKHGVTRQELNWFIHQIQFGNGDLITALILKQK